MFTPAVEARQIQKGSRAHYQRMEDAGGWRTLITDDLKQFIEEQDSVFLATTSADGQPYVQHRGGPPGFLRVLDEKTIAFADFAGNRQYITWGNLTENPKFFLFLIDYEHRRRIKLWGTAVVIEDDVALIARLKPEGYRARAERAMLLRLTGWDENCPQHIPQRVEVPSQ